MYRVDMTNNETQQINELSANIGKNLRDLRKSHGLTVATLSELTENAGYKIAANTITNIELRRKSSVSAEELFTLSTVLNVPVTQLLSKPKNDELERIVQSKITRLKGAYEEFSEAAKQLLHEANHFFDDLPAGLSQSEYEELEKLKKARQEEWENLTTWNALEETVYLEISEQYNHEPEPLDLFNFENETKQRYGVRPVTTFDPLEEFFNANWRQKSKQEQKNLNALIEENKDWTPPF